MLKKFKRRASRIRFAQKKILIVIEIDSCEWVNCDESFTPQHHCHTNKDNNNLPLSNSQSSSNLQNGSSSMGFSQPSATLQGDKLFHALYNHALAPFYPIPVPLGSYFSLSVDKAGKCFMSTEQELIPDPQSVLMKKFGQKRESITAIAQWHREIIECTGTLYYDPKTHLFQEKSLIIKLKMKKREGNSAIPLPTFGRDTQHLTLGKFIVPLHRIIHEQLIAYNLSLQSSHPHNLVTATSNNSKSVTPTTTSTAIYPTQFKSSSLSDSNLVTSRTSSHSPANSGHEEEDGGEEHDEEGEEDDNHSDDAIIPGLRESSSSDDHLPNREERVPITSWNNIEKRIDIPLDEHANIILHGRVLVKFLPDEPYPTHGIDNYFAKLMAIKANDHEETEFEHDQGDRKLRKEALVSLQQEDSDENHAQNDNDDEEDASDDGYPDDEIHERRKFLDQDDRMSSISSLTSSNSPHSTKRKIFIKDLLLSATAAANASIHHSTQRFPANFPTAFFKKVKDRLQSPRSTSFMNLNQSTATNERGVLMRQESDGSNDSNDSSLYGPTSYPQPSEQSNPKLRKPLTVSFKTMTPSPVPSRKGSDASNILPEDITNLSKASSTISQSSAKEQSLVKSKLDQLWMELNQWYLTNDGVFLLIITVILLIIVCEAIRRHFVIIPPPVEINTAAAPTSTTSCSSQPMPSYTN